MVVRFLASSIIFSRCLHSPSSRVTPAAAPHSIQRKLGRSRSASREMGTEYLDRQDVKAANLRLCKVSSYTTELLEIQSDNPTLHVLVIPGNPAIGHIAQTKKNWEHGKLFSLQEQVNHKVDYISQELQDTEVPIMLVGHSIGSYIAMETFRRKQNKVIYVIGLYPFIMLNPLSKEQAIIGRISSSPLLSGLISLLVAFVGLILPEWLSTYMAVKYIGNSSLSRSAVETARTHLLKYHVFRNVLYMAMTEFTEFSQAPDWEFMRDNHSKMAFLFGVGDYWGPLEVYEEIAKQVPEMNLAIEREGLPHSFCCTEAGSIWVSSRVASLIKNQTSSNLLAADAKIGHGG
ncbi:Lipid droplet-associated hydrolase [Linum perenne]